MMLCPRMCLQSKSRYTVIPVAVVTMALSLKASHGSCDTFEPIGEASAEHRALSPLVSLSSRRYDAYLLW